MELIGLDFDNTLVRYDKLFHQLAVEKGLITQSMKCCKTTIRDYLRSQEKDYEFTILQAEVYGNKIRDAEPSKDMIDALIHLKKDSRKLVIISHKTEYPYKGPRLNLRTSAMKWLEKNRFFDKDGIGMSIKDVYFEDTKEKKAARIHNLGCNYYIDDLVEILTMINKDVKKILYEPKEESGLSRFDDIMIMHSWKELKELLK
ncbi:hypothetical protein [Synechococcus sp. A15-24]|uniref:hypothetical protein n=1 Tax=Synechococcus sp. A15-24 TaxID=1050635 RepID=UPI0018603AE3|nr:hypothetical protein [Synechococcus sp. A15-24]QNJ27831.1 hypothetical protein SynA1524_00110 [Synechococcus sp. A15-24]